MTRHTSSLRTVGRRGLGLSAIATVVVVAGAMQLSGALTSSRSPHKSQPKPTGSVTVSRKTFSSVGGVESLTVNVQHATTCSLVSVPIVSFTPGKGSCSSGQFKSAVLFGANATTKAAVYAVHAVIVGGGHTVSTPVVSITIQSPSTSLGVSWSGASPLSRQSGGADAISCASTTSCVVVDANGYESTLSGSSWAAPHSVDTFALTGVSCPTTNFCDAVDGAGQYTHFNGTSWSTPVQISTTPLVAVSCSSVTYCIAGATDGKIFTWSSNSWNAGVQVSSNSLSAVSCGPSNTCVAVDPAGYAYAKSGSTWTTGALVDSSNGFAGVSCPSATFCAAIDTAGNAYYDSSGTWGSAVNTHASSPTAISCSSSISCAVTNNDGSVSSLAGSTWSAASAAGGLTDSLTGVSCLSDTTCVLTDFNGVVITGFAATWHTTSTDPLASFFASVSCGSPTLCVALQANGTAALWNGGWGASSSSGVAGADSISCSGSFCVAVGTNGTAATFNGTSWSSTQQIDSSPLVGVSCTSSTFCLAIDDVGGLVRWSGHWGSRIVGTTSTAYFYSDVSCASSNFCVIVTTAGVAILYNGSSFSKYTMDAVSIAASGVSCPSTTYCVAVDEKGDAITFAKSGPTMVWTSPKLVDANGLTSVSCFNTSACVGVDSNGGFVILHNNKWSSPSYADPLSNIVAVSCNLQPSCVLVDQANRGASLSI